MSPALATTAAPALEIAPVSSAELIAFPTGRYAIPHDDMAAFTTLPIADQERIKQALIYIAKMEKEGVTQMSATLAFQLRNVPGWSRATLTNLYYRWKEHGWVGLKRNYNSGKDPLPREFIQHFRALCENNGRSIAQARNALIRAWYAGESIPGFGTWREWHFSMWPERDIPLSCQRTPDGWGKSNLYTLQPTKAQRALKTRGVAAARAHLLTMMRDPSRLLPLQLVVIDDFECDQECVVRGQRKLCRMVGIAAMDVATRRIIGMVMKPRLTDDEGKQQAITRAEVRVLLYQMLKDHGVPAHGMTILCEKAAAAITAELETTFLNLFGGRVSITRTTTLDHKTLAGGFNETGGKPWLKGWIESFFNLLHNVAAGVVQGNKGRNYIHKPADLEEKKRYTERLLGTGNKDANLTDEQVERVILPFSSPEELCDLYLKIFSWIEGRTDHDLLGFDEIQEWRAHPSEAPRPLAELNSTVARQFPDYEILSPRKESPRERWDRLYPHVQRNGVEPYVLMLLLLTPKKAKRSGFKLTFAHNGQGYTWVIPPRGELAETLADNTECLVYFDPADARIAHVARMNGSYLGEVKRWGAVDITDSDAVTTAERELAKLYAEVRATVAERPLHVAENDRLVAMRGHNDAIKAETAPAVLSLKQSLNREVPATPDGNPVTGTGANLAARIGNAKQAEAIVQREKKALARRVQARAAKLTAEDTNDFLSNEEKPAAPASTGTTGSANTAGQDDTLASYL